jgi:hypothetical protein
VDALGGGLIVVGSLQFGGVVVLGKIVTDGDLPVPAYLAAAAVLLAVALAATRQPLAAARRKGWRGGQGRVGPGHTNADCGRRAWAVRANLPRRRRRALRRH